MLMNHIARKNCTEGCCWLPRGFLLDAQRPLTVPPSTGRVGVGNANPTEALDVTGTVNATAVRGDRSLE